MGHTGDSVGQWLSVCLRDLAEHVGCVSAWGCLIEQCDCSAAFHLRVSKVTCFLLPTDNFRYTCDICGKKYKYYSCFQEHRDLHAVDGE